MTADEIISLLGLERHPEGGWFRQTFEDRAPGQRARSTAIYFLLARDEVSHWHHVDAVETWHYYSGAPIALSIAPPNGPATEMILGPDLAAGQRPQGIVPTGQWQSARSLGDWTLVGCTVAPGFEFSGFVLAPPGWFPGAD